MKPKINIRVSLTESKLTDEYIVDNLNQHYDYREDHLLLPPHAINPHDRAKNSAIATKLYNETMPLITDALNIYHNVGLARRDWSILIGHFVERSSRVFTNRINGLKEIESKNKIDYLKIRELNIAQLSSQNSYDAIWKFSNLEWNEQLYSFIVNIFFKHKKKTIPCAEKKTSTTKNKKNLRHVIKTGLFKLFSICRVLSSENDIFVSKTYLGFWVYLTLIFKLRQLPQVYYERYLPINENYNLEDRKKIAQNLITSNELFEKSFIKWVMLTLPKCYIEDFKSLTDQAIKVNWPKKPKYILSANDFDTNDLYKKWLVDKIKMNARYIVLQHGATYGTDKLSKPSLEERTADTFITWGWGSGKANYVAGGMQLRPYWYRQKNHSQEKILLVQRAPFQKVRVHDVNYDYHRSFIEQTKFIGKLKPHLRDALTVRLQSDWQLHGFNDYERWCAILGEEKIDPGTQKFYKVYNNYTLLIFCYESTGFLQALAGGMPCIGIWKHAFDFLIPTAQDDYMQMKKVGLIRDNYDELADFLNTTDVKTWWDTEEVRKVRKKFAIVYCNNRPMLNELLKVMQ